MPQNACMGIARIGAAALVLFALTSCATPAPTPSAAPSAPVETPTPTPTPEAPEVATLALAADGFELRDDAGTVLDEFGWFDDADATIDALTEAFGEEPIEVDYPGHIESRPGIDYTWEGFVVRVQDFEPTPPLDSNVTVTITAPTVGDIELLGPDGIVVGQDATALTSAGEAWGEPFESEDGVTVAWYKLDTVQPDPAGPEENYTVAQVDVDAVTVSQIFAPATNYGV